MSLAPGQIPSASTGSARDQSHRQLQQRKESTAHNPVRRRSSLAFTGDDDSDEDVDIDGDDTITDVPDADEHLYQRNLQSTSSASNEEGDVSPAEVASSQGALHFAEDQEVMYGDDQDSMKDLDTVYNDPEQPQDHVDEPGVTYGGEDDHPMRSDTQAVVFSAEEGRQTTVYGHDDDKVELHPDGQESADPDGQETAYADDQEAMYVEGQEAVYTDDPDAAYTDDQEAVNTDDQEAV
jgi:hypothetical protein